RSRQADRGAREGGRHHAGRVRPRGLSVSRPREGSGRRCPQGRTGVLIMTNPSSGGGAGRGPGGGGGRGGQGGGRGRGGPGGGRGGQGGRGGGPGGRGGGPGG